MHQTALLLSALTGEPVTAAQLLGEEINDAQSKEAEAEKALKRLQRKMRKAGL